MDIDPLDTSLMYRHAPCAGQPDSTGRARCHLQAEARLYQIRKAANSTIHSALKAVSCNHYVDSVPFCSSLFCLSPIQHMTVVNKLVAVIGSF